MLGTTTVELLGHEAVVVKRATGGADVEALRREGERLRRAAHPGVVAVVRSAPCQDGWELVTRHGGRPLDAGGAPPAHEVARLVASVASTIADLHDLGVVHGRVDRSHVLVGDHGRVRLCGFGSADTAPRSDDVAGLGRLLIDLLGDEPDLQLPAGRRGWRAARRGASERRTLLALAEHATAEPPSRRPTARRFAAALSDVAPVDHPEPRHLAGGPLEPDDGFERLRLAPDEVSEPRARWRRPGVVAAVAMALVVAGLVRPSSGSPDATAPALDGSAPVVRTAAPVAGSVLVEDGRRYRVGAPGDHLLVDDWSCDGHPTPAVFRPATHQVFVFETWTADVPIAVEPVATIAGARELVSQREADGCPTLMVRVASGRLVPVELGPA